MEHTNLAPSIIYRRIYTGSEKQRKKNQETHAAFVHSFLTFFFQIKFMATICTCTYVSRIVCDDAFPLMWINSRETLTKCRANNDKKAQKEKQKTIAEKMSVASAMISIYEMMPIKLIWRCHAKDCMSCRVKNNFSFQNAMRATFIVSPSLSLSTLFSCAHCLHCHFLLCFSHFTFAHIPNFHYYLVKAKLPESTNDGRRTRSKRELIARNSSLHFAPTVKYLILLLLLSFCAAAQLEKQPSSKLR